jgi:hypothetical protein
MPKRSLWNGSAGRVLTELLYGIEGIDRKGLEVHVDRASMSKRLRITKDRLERVLEWLEDQKLISDLELRYKSFGATLRPITDVDNEIKVYRGAGR